MGKTNEHDIKSSRQIEQAIPFAYRVGGGVGGSTQIPYMHWLCVLFIEMTFKLNYGWYLSEKFTDLTFPQSHFERIMLVCILFNGVR